MTFSFIIPITVFLVIVAPIWLFFHYQSKKQLSQGFSDEEYIQLTELSALADQMAERIQTLESILDVETPDWRTKL